MPDHERRPGRRLALYLWLLCLALPALAFDAAQYEKAATTILCDCGCHPQSVQACACGRAAEMRDEIRAMIAAGRTGDEVIAAYVERGGEQVRIAPTVRGFNLLAWLGPVLGLVLSLGALALLVRRWSRRGIDAPVEARPTFDESDPYAARLRREIEELR